MSHNLTFIPSLNTKFGKPGKTSSYTRYYLCSLCRTKMSNDESDGSCNFCSDCKKFSCDDCSGQNCSSSSSTSTTTTTKRTIIQEPLITVSRDTVQLVVCSQNTLQYRASTYATWGLPPEGKDQWICTICSGVLYRRSDGVDKEAWNCTNCKGVFCANCRLNH